MPSYETNTSSFLVPILELVPDAIIWVRPLTNSSGDVDDFEIGYANAPAAAAINHPKGRLQGLRILGDGVPSVEGAPANFNHFLDVYRSGMAKEYMFYARYSGRQMETLRLPYSGGVLSFTRDRRAQREAERSEKHKTELLNGVVHNAPMGIEVYKALRNEAGQITDFSLEFCNDTVQELTGFPIEERSGLSFKDLLHRLEAAGEIFGRYVNTVETGAPFSLEYQNLRTRRWLHLSAVKMGDGFLVMLSDISAVKKAQGTLQLQSDYLESILNASPNGISTYEAVRDAGGTIVDLRYMQVNKAFELLSGRQAEEVIGKTMLQVFPTVQHTEAFAAYLNVVETGRPTRFDMYYNGEGLDAWFDITAAKVGEDGVVVTFSDITEQKKTYLEVERQKTLLDNLLQFSPSGISVIEALRDEHGAVVDFRNIVLNETAAQITGLPRAVLLSRTNLEIDPNFKNSPAHQMLVHTLQTGEPSFTDYRLEPTGKWMEGAVSKMDNNHLICIITDVTASREIHRQVEASHEKLRAVVNTSQTGFFMGVPVLDHKGAITDFRFTLINPVLAAFTGKKAEELIGELGSRWFARYKTNGLFERFRDTWLSGTKQQFDFHYLAETADVWVNISLARLGDELLGSFTDFTPIKRLQLQLEASVEELKHSNANLEEFAHAASHDLKEPIRKIQTFAGRLKDKLSARMDETERSLFERMESATGRMGQLVEDLLQYSQVSMQTTQAEDVDLNAKIRTVLTDLEVQVEEKGAIITVGELPVVRGYRRQLQQLFQNLISNALKYSKPGEVPQVRITAKVVSAQELPLETPDPSRSYHLIQVSDNGIGFDPQYAERIFQMFQRLHGRSEYPGTGIGLSIVRKVAENHGGYVTAESMPGEGATFNVYLPV